MRRAMRMIVLLLCAPVFFSSCAYALNSEEIDRLIKSNAPGYSLSAGYSLSTYANAYYNKNFPDGDPRFVYGDFNGSGFNDYAVISEKRGTDNKYFLILVSSKENELSLGHKVNLDGFDDVFLSLIEPGNIIKQSLSIPTNDDASKEIELERASFLLTYFEKASVAFCWDHEKEKVLSIQLTD